MHDAQEVLSFEPLYRFFRVLRSSRYTQAPEFKQQIFFVVFKFEYLR